MARVEQVNKQFNTGSGSVTALQDVNVAVEPAQIVTVIGASGAGKSTLLRCFNVLERPDSGQIWVGQQDLMTLSASQLRAARHHIGMVFQHFNLLGTRNVFDNVALPLRLQGKSEADIKQRVESLLVLVGLSDRQDSYPSRLSGGQKQRVAIARALVTEPQVLLCDEATSALDAQTAQDILALLKQVRDKFNVAIVMVTHQLDVVKNIADRVVVMAHGRVVECADVLDFFAHPQSEAGQRLISACYHQPLPEVIANDLHTVAQQDNDHPVIRLTFCGELTSKPLIAELMEQHGIRLNILQASVEALRGQLLGRLVVSVDAPVNTLGLLENALNQHGVTVDVIGYLPA